MMPNDLNHKVTRLSNDGIVPIAKKWFKKEVDKNTWDIWDRRGMCVEKIR